MSLVFDLTNKRCRFELKGSDRVRYLNGQVTNDVRKVSPQQSLLAAVLTNKGKLQGDLWIHAKTDRLFLDAPIELREALFARLSKYIISDDAELIDITDEWKQFHQIGDTPTSTFSVNRFFISGKDIWISSQDKVDLTVATEEQFEEARIEHGVPLWNIDMSENNLPPEVLPESEAISYTKGCYIGQEVIARIKSIGRVNKKLCYLKSLDSISNLTFPATLMDQDKEAGTLTSFNKKGTGLGIVKISHLEPNKKLETKSISWTINPLPYE